MEKTALSKDIIIKDMLHFLLITVSMVLVFPYLYAYFVSLPFINQLLIKNSSIFFKTFLSATYILVTPSSILFVLKKYPLKEYGLCLPVKSQFFQFLSLSIGISLTPSLTPFIFPKIRAFYMPINFTTSFFFQLLLMWFYIAFCEEIFVRGFFQKYICFLKKYNIYFFNLPILISALFSSSLHLLLLRTGINNYLILFIMFSSSFSIGLVASYYKDKTKSVFLPIVAHFVFYVITGSMSFFY